MVRSLRPIASLLTGTALLLLGVGLLNTLIPLRGGTLGYSAVLLGALTSAYYAGYFVGTFTLPRLVQRIGYIRAFAFCTASVTIVVLLHALFDAAWTWLLLRLLAGVVLVGLYTIIESWLNAVAQPEQRGAVFATYMVVNLGSLALAQQLLRLSGPPFMLFVLVALLICAAMLPVVLTRQAQPLLQPRPRLRVRQLFALAPSAAIGALLTGLSMGALWGLLPVYARSRGLENSAVGNWMSVVILGGALLQWPAGRLSDRHDRRIALSIVCAAACVLAALVPLAGHRTVAALVMLFLFGGMTFAVYPIVVAHLVDHVPREDLLSASSSVLLVYGIGSAVGPLAAGALMQALGPWSLFAWFAIMHGLLAAYAGYRYVVFRREQTPDSGFTPMLRTTPVALDMLPATDFPADDPDPPPGKGATH